MLVFSRKEGNKIRIGEDIWVEIIGITEGGRIKIAVDAPEDVAVTRAELVETAADENRAAAQCDCTPAMFARQLKMMKEG